MRVWTEATFNAAIELDLDTQDPVLWLPSEGAGQGRLTTFLDAMDRAGNRVGRLTAIIGIGCLACGAIPNSALAPVGSAHAAVERFKLQPVFPVLPEQVSAPVQSESAPASPVSRRPGEDVFAAAPQVGDLPAVKNPDVIQHPSFDQSRDEVEEFLRFGSRELPRRLVETIVKAAVATDVDPIYLMALADKESSFRTDVKASSSSAEGLFQFVDRTWLDTVKTFGPKHGLAAEAALIESVDDKLCVVDDGERTRILGLRRDPYLAAVMAAEMLRRDAALIGLRIGRELNATEMYLAHFLGLDGAGRFIAMKAAKKAKSATVAFPAAARANVAIFFGRGKKGRRKGLSVPEVYAKIDQMIDARLEMFRPVKVIAQAGANG
jgi:hypothetical protein